VDRSVAGDPRRQIGDPVPEYRADPGPTGAGLGEQALSEPVAFEDLFAAEHRRLFGALCLITRDQHEAEDIGQEAFVRVLERWDRVGTMVDPAGYLYRVAMNVLRGRYRRARVAAKRLFAGRPKDEIAEVEDRDLVSRMLGALTPRQRAALVLTTVLDYSSEEAGEILGLPGSSVRVLTTRARATLRQRTWEGG
jgi:RNA polymerase sigma-70 factor, ECF subfamily